MSGEFVVGIDLGTTNSCVSVYKNNAVKIIPNSNNENITPSYVGFDVNCRLVGNEAKAKAPFNPENTIFDAKRLIGRKFDDSQVQDDMKTWPFKVISECNKPKISVNYKKIQRSYYPEEISSMVLSELKDIAEKYLKVDVTKCVITVPAYFNDSQRQATIDAGKLAGLNVMRVINEPTAAAIAYGFIKKSSSEQNVLIYDLGGGTFDVSILKIKGTEMKVLSTGGNTHLGGEDFDNRTVKYVIEEFERNNGVCVGDNPKALKRIRSACEKAKIQLSTATEYKIDIVGLLVKQSDNELVASTDMDISLTREKFEELNEELFQSTLTTIIECLTGAKLNKTNIDEVVLVGGSSRIPRIRSIVQNFFVGKELNKTINPDEAVAYGAAISAALLQDYKTKEIEEVSFFDVTPMSLGTDIWSRTLTSVIIPKNSPIPTKFTKKYYVMNTTTMHIDVLEGEAKLCKDNNNLGQFDIEGLFEKSGKCEAEVTFAIDENGILTVDAEDIGSSVKGQLKIKYDKGRLSEKDIKRILDENKAANDEKRARDELVKAKNDLFNYCDDILRDVEIKYKNKSHRKEIIDLKKMCHETIDWIDACNHDNKHDFEKKLNEIEIAFENLSYL